MNELLPFEKEKCRDLRRFPMHFRLKLDVCGIKLSKRDWLAFDTADKVALIAMPCDTPAQLVLFREKLQDLIQAYGGNVTEITPRSGFSAAYRPWTDKSKVPETVRQPIDMLTGGAAQLERWENLSDLQRFALIKLTEPGKIKPQLRSVLKEFSLLPLECD